MTVIGFGKMGKRFTRLFSNSFEVHVSSSRDVSIEVNEMGVKVCSDREQCLADSNYIFLAVPISALSELVDEINSIASDHVIVIDCCSARVPSEQVLSKLKPQHFGIHDIKQGEFYVTGEMNAEMEHFFSDQQITIQQSTPEKHDCLNAIIGLGHFIGLSLGQFLSETDREVLSGMGSGSKLLSFIDHFVGNSPTTWRETQIDNLFTKKQRTEFIQALSKYNQNLGRRGRTRRGCA